ncbi:Carboxylic ester hydrolase [Mycena sanguinolenta]|uniref:Carboxylic ester hydrolase n=1 Tax=Mycena sanguinolenta TaxID=230812 RepID=A0A8H6XRZ7_9AGAR|nr:Carboxylic ester hydrolase [Mycena sanguinolenta]
MASLSLPAAELVAHTVGGVLYGIYLVTLGIAGRKILFSRGWKRRTATNWINVVVLVVLFTNGTLNFVVSTIEVIQAFVLYTGPGGAAEFFAHGSGWQTLTKSFTVPFQSLVGDGILIYRCWVIWNNSWIIIVIPLLIWLANIACAARLLDLLTKATLQLVISSPIQPWGQAFWSMTICISVMATSLIVVRIWRVERKRRKHQRSHINSIKIVDQRSNALGHAMRNIIESGMIYTVVSIFTLVTYTMQSTLHYPVSSMELHSVGITFNLILIRGSRTARSHQDVSVFSAVQLQFTQAETQTHASGENTATAIHDSEASLHDSRPGKGVEFASV